VVIDKYCGLVGDTRDFFSGFWTLVEKKDKKKNHSSYISTRGEISSRINRISTKTIVGSLLKIFAEKHIRRTCHV